MGAAGRDRRVRFGKRRQGGSWRGNGDNGDEVEAASPASPKRARLQPSRWAPAELEAAIRERVQAQHAALPPVSKSDMLNMLNVTGSAVEPRGLPGAPWHSVSRWTAFCRLSRWSSQRSCWTWV